MNTFWPGHSPAGQGDNDVDDQDNTQPHPYGQPHVLPPKNERKLQEYHTYKKINKFFL